MSPACMSRHGCRTALTVAAASGQPLFSAAWKSAMTALARVLFTVLSMSWLETSAQVTPSRAQVACTNCCLVMLTASAAGLASSKR